MKTSTKGLIAVIVVLAVFGAIGLFFAFNRPAPELSYDEFLRKIEAGEVSAVSVDDYVATVTLRGKDADGRTKYKVNVRSLPNEGASYETYIINFNADEQNADKLIKLTYNNPNAGAVWNLVIPVLGFVLLVVLAIFLFRSMSGANKQTMNFGKSKANAQSNLKVRFTDVAG